MAEKSTFLRKFHFFFFWLGPVLGGPPVPGKRLMHFRPGGGQKSRKNRKTGEKVEIFQNFKIDPKVKICSYGGQFWPKSRLFCEIFVFFCFFLTGACTGRAPTTGEKTYAFSAGKPKTGRYLFAEQRFPWACLREPLLREQILHKGSVVCVPLCFFF